MIGWTFPPNNDGIAAGANDGAIDAFAGKRLSSVTREIIQNSLDAKKSGEHPVRLHFSVQTISANEFDGFANIAPHIQKSVEIAEKQGLGEVVQFYQHGLTQIEKSKEIKVFCIHDYNTKGLTGPIDEPFGPWHAITKGAGISQKSSSGSLGSFGHGSKAPFLYSDTRTVFYLTKIDTDDGQQERFQGKSILQSHESIDFDGIYTQGTGFYGHVDRLKALIDDEVPNWARKLRHSVTLATGTSIYLPYTSYSAELYPETKITIIGNFFYAIMSGELEVTIGDEEINQNNLQEHFYECQSILKHEHDEIDVRHIEDCFESAKTIIEHTHHSAQEIIGFGKILWWMRLTDEVSWRSVGVARSSGMLITRKPMQLTRFTGVNNFDLFVCVKGSKGSNLLKSLENPTHDKFDIDRIKIESVRKDSLKKYKLFSNKVRDVVNIYAAINATEEENLDDLSFLFSEVGEEVSVNNEKTERGKKLRIFPGPTFMSTQQRSRRTELDYISNNSAIFNRKKPTADRSRTSAAGTTIIKGKPAHSGMNAAAKSFNVQNLRIAHLKNSAKKAKLFCESPISGEFNLSIATVGEHGSDPIQMVCKGKLTKVLAITVEAGKRHELEVEFETPVGMFVMEASLNEN